MHNKMSNIIRLKYILIAIVLFCVGLALMFTFFLMITLPFAGSLGIGGNFPLLGSNRKTLQRLCNNIAVARESYKLIIN
jgi:hypothetical protein